MRRLFLRLAGTGTVCAILLTGCGGGSAGPDSVVQPQSNPPPTTDPSATPTADPSAEPASACPGAIEGSGHPRRMDGSCTEVQGDISGHFSPAGTMNVARSGHSAVMLNNGKVLILGGGAEPELYDPDDGSFVPTGTMASTSPGAIATPLADGRVLVTGGRDAERTPTAEIYDPLTGAFARTGNLLVDQWGYTSTPLQDGRVLIAGGMVAGVAHPATAAAQIFDPSAGRFTMVGPMMTDRAAHTATLLDDGQVLIVGGWNGHMLDAADDPPWDPMFAELFDPVTSTFRSAATMSTTRGGGPVAIRLADGNVLVLGGIWALQNVHEQPAHPSYAEIYDAASSTFRPFPTSLWPYEHAATTLLSSGKVLLIGHDSAGLSRSAVLLDPGTGSLTPGGSLLTPRSGFTVTRLRDGRVLITGGTDAAGNALSSAEIWSPLE